MKLINLPSTTAQQEEIIYYLYEFRYLIVKQLMKLLSHKDPRRIHEWLNDLVKSKYITKIISEEISRGPIYCLDSQARHILKKDKSTDETFLGRLYKEKAHEPPLIKKHLFICDIFLYFLSQKKKGQELNFFTEQELKAYAYFPEQKPSAYIEQIEGKETNRYFLEYFDEYSPHAVARNKVQSYLDYCQNGDWQANTEDAPFPTVLFVLPTYMFKKHIEHYAGAVFGKNLNDGIDLFLTTKQEIKTGNVTWDPVKPKE